MSKIVLTIIFSLLLSAIGFAQLVPADTIKSNEGNIIIQPITHGTLVLQWNNTTIYVDPYGGAELFKGIAPPDLILITDIHGDHTNLETLKGLDLEKAKFIVPAAVAEMLKPDYADQLEIINNGEMSVQGDIFINAIPMYNLPEDETSRHPKGRGNGYFLNLGGKAIYISGDTEDIKEMRGLKDIDIAFVCMNLPYTMDINQAADAVLEFKPKVVYPYHYRGKPDMSDTEAFKKLVNSENTEIEVRLRDWYKK
ncbi:MBL fold metallo-hydrolase [Aureibaculum sp. 2210JD6-5]|uniref:MBL fold metallo-hydrolase n=1 Tax=Aureibaculum sp. 2210JD6-5 TaxID=3103957 RepID=UPI002AADD4B3|nr:MBL fold metallo-hydrolase [Aureibaculum sp. 2210JD6-5]MDY7394165.1 MBL fold metallo-hydrolase [Aureibaculum sp. 2210JD6-5]